jgi:hypothetical protein
MTYLLVIVKINKGVFSSKSLGIFNTINDAISMANNSFNDGYILYDLNQNGIEIDKYGNPVNDNDTSDDSSCDDYSYEPYF